LRFADRYGDDDAIEQARGAADDVLVPARKRVERARVDDLEHEGRDTTGGRPARTGPAPLASARAREKMIMHLPPLVAAVGRESRGRRERPAGLRVDQAAGRKARGGRR